MTIDPIDPPRLEDGDDVVLRELMLRRRRGPSATSVEKISQKLATAGVLQSASSGATQLGSLRAASYKIGGAALLLAGGFFVAWQGIHSSAPSPSPSFAASAGPATPSVADIAETTPAVLAKDPLPVATNPTSERAVRSAVSVNMLPSAAPIVETAKRGPLLGSAAPKATPPAAERRVAIPAINELELVQRAEAALASDPQRALALANEHTRAFPSGEFLQEREVIAIDALARLGRKDESLRRARALVQRFPQTPYSARIEMAVGETLTP